MGHQNIWNTHPRNYGRGSRRCRITGNRHGLIRKYGLNISRQCFREYAKDIGFQKTAHGEDTWLILVEYMTRRNVVLLGWMQSFLVLGLVEVDALVEKLAHGETKIAWSDVFGFGC